jgi:ABC-type amino acid transport substrate-binding protein
MKKMKMFAGILAGLMMCVAAAGCGGSTSSNDKKAADSKKELIVGTNPSFAPFEFTDKKDGKVQGFDIDLINALAKKAGYEKVTIKSIAFDGLIPSLESGNIDVSITGMSITDARKQKVNFTDPYYESGLMALVKKDNDAIKNLDDLKGKTIAVQIGTTGAKYAENHRGRQGQDLRQQRSGLPGTEERRGRCSDQRPAGAPVLPETGRQRLRQERGYSQEG